MGLSDGASSYFVAIMKRPRFDRFGFMRYQRLAMTTVASKDLLSESNAMRVTKPRFTA